MWVALGYMACILTYHSGKPAAARDVGAGKEKRVCNNDDDDLDDLQACIRRVCKCARAQGEKSEEDVAEDKDGLPALPQLGECVCVLN